MKNDHAQGSSNLIYNLPEGLNTRSMCAVSADEENQRFLVGSCSLQMQNAIHVINYMEDTNTVDLAQILPFSQGEIWDLRSSPYSAKEFACSFSTIEENQSGIHLIRMHEQQPEGDEEG